MPVLQELSDDVPSDVAAAARYNHFHAAYLLKYWFGARLVFTACRHTVTVHVAMHSLSRPIRSYSRFAPTNDSFSPL